MYNTIEGLSKIFDFVSAVIFTIVRSQDNSAEVKALLDQLNAPPPPPPAPPPAPKPPAPPVRATAPPVRPAVILPVRTPLVRTVLNAPVRGTLPNLRIR